MDLKQLEYIVTIAEEKSFSKAARKLYISQSALSQCLHRLETFEKLPPLFRKEKNELLLTDAGRIYVNGAKTILNMAAEADLAAQKRCSTIRISVAPICEFLFLTEVLPGFKKLYPDVSLSIRYYHSDTAKQQIIEGQLDLAVVIDQLPDYSLFRSFPIYEDQVIWTASSMISGNFGDLPVIMPPAGTFWRRTCDDIYYQEEITGEIYCETVDLNIINTLISRLPATSFLLTSAYLNTSDMKKLPLKRTYPYYITAIMSHTTAVTGPMEDLTRLILELMNPFKIKKGTDWSVYRRPDIR